MSDKDVTDAVIAALVDGNVVADSKIFAGRIYPSSGEVWSVSLQTPAASYGGSNASYKLRYNVSIDAYASDAEKLYGKTEAIRQALATMRTNPQIISVSVGGLQDMDTEGSEMRHIQWVAQIISYVPGWMDWDE